MNITRSTNYEHCKNCKRVLGICSYGVRGIYVQTIWTGQITKWGETVKEFNETVARFERAEKDINERLKKYPEKTEDLQWSLSLVREYLERCYEVKKVLGL